MAQILSDKQIDDIGIYIVRRVQRILYSDGHWKIKVVPKESNKIADRLAKDCFAWKSSLQLFDMPPKEVLGDLQENKIRSVIEPLI